MANNNLEQHKSKQETKWGHKRVSCVLTMALIGTMVLSGCSVTESGHSLNSATGVSAVHFDPPLNSTFTIDPDEIYLVTPDLKEREENQVMLTYLTKLLSDPNATSEQRAQIFYQLGIIYDRLGLEAMARSMFMSALVEVPDFAPAYNFLGIYLAGAERFAEAYDAYDAVLELTPDDEYAHFNRGIALYYGNRPKLGIPDLEFFYDKNPDDPFRSLWIYILEREVMDQKEALAHLAERRTKINPETPWGLEVLDYFLGEKSEYEVIDAIRSAQLTNEERARRLCEAYFYLGKQADFEGNYKRAYDLYHLCITTGVTGYLEYRYALMEIGRYQRMEQVAKAEALANRQQAQRLENLSKQAEEGHKFFENLHHKVEQQSQDLPAPEPVPQLQNSQLPNPAVPQLDNTKVPAAARGKDQAH